MGDVTDPLIPRLNRYGSSIVPETNKNNLGTFNGVYIPCVMNILGVILFMRMSWAVGQAGWLNVLLMFFVGETAALLTVLSMSALISTGNIQGGGSYFLLSRCLGPEIGGAIGVFFYLAYAVGTSFYVVSFATEIVEVFFNFEDRIVDDHGHSFADTSPVNYTVQPDPLRRQYITLIASVALWCVTFVSYLGANSFAKINAFVFSLQFTCILCGMGSMWLTQLVIGKDNLPYVLPENNKTRYTGWSTDNFVDNAYSRYTADSKCEQEQCSFRLVFGILFNAVTGIMEGANLSGDLKDPKTSIPRGTIAAVCTCWLFYSLLIFTFSFNFERETLQLNANVMQDITYPSHYITVVGISIAAFSAALGSLFGGARVLQALARDNLPPDVGLSFFGKGSKKGDEPVRAVFLTCFIAQICTFIGDLDRISPIIASFFLITYASVNLTCLLLNLSGTPNFRPTFRYHSRNQAFAGMSLCLGIMIYLNVYYALYAILLIAFLVGYISIKIGKDQAKDWGDVSQALMYHQVRKYLYRLNDNNHPKHWRPSLLLLLPSMPYARSEDGFGTFKEAEEENNGLYSLLLFCNRLKKGGLFIVGHPLVADKEESHQSGLIEQTFDLKAELMNSLKALKIKGIAEVLVCSDLEKGFFSMVALAGLGGMKPNTVMMPFKKENGKDLFLAPSSLYRTIQNILLLKKNVLINTSFTDQAFQSSESLTAPESYYVNVVIIGNDIRLEGWISLQLQLGFVLCNKHRRYKLRLINLTGSVGNIERNIARMKRLCVKARIPNSKRVIKVSVVSGLEDYDSLSLGPSKLGEGPVQQRINLALREVVDSDYSEDAVSDTFFISAQPFFDNIGQRDGKREKVSRSLHSFLEEVSIGLSNTVFTIFGEENDIITQDL